jgi:phosphatidate cytidylyltransferase
MLWQRVVTAVALLALLLPALFANSPVPFTGLVLVLIAAGAWEWGRLNGCSQTASLMLSLVCLGLCATAWLSGWPDQSMPLLWLAAGAGWVLVGAGLLRAGVPGWPLVPLPIRLTGGVLSLFLAWLAVAQARAIGINFLLSMLVLVWVADIFAYFAGRAFGLRFTRSKLAPSISPGKSWEGVWGGMAGVVGLGLAWVAADSHWQAAVPSLYSRLSAISPWLLIVAVVFLCAMSVVGDLVESLIKRSAGVKDSSRLLPGHGGVLDRVDALLPALPVAMMIFSLVPR